MKKDRNCGMSMPIYPTYPMPNMMPGVPSMGAYSMGGPANIPYDISNSFNGSIEQQLSSLSNQISSLERRVNNIKNLVGNNSTSYNTSNYQML